MTIRIVLRRPAQSGVPLTFFLGQVANCVNFLVYGSRRQIGSQKSGLGLWAQRQLIELGRPSFLQRFLLGF